MSPAVSNIDTKFYRKSSHDLPGSVNLDAETARVFAVIDGNTQLSKVAELAEVSTAILWKAVAKLTRLGLIEDADDNAGFMGQLFADKLHKELTKAVGPISNLLLKNVATQLDISFPNIPVERAREFVFKLADRIPDERASAEFQLTILKDI